MAHETRLQTQIMAALKNRVGLARSAVALARVELAALASVATTDAELRDALGDAERALERLDGHIPD